MKRFASRKLSRNRQAIEVLNPCVRFSPNGGYNPLAALFARIMEHKEPTPEEKAAKHNLKMVTDQKSAKARSQRRKSTQNRGN